MSATTSESIQSHTRVARSEAIVFSEIDDEIVMMDLKQGSYYEMDAVAARIWALVESRPRVSEVCEGLVAQYDVAPDTCGNEVLAFLDELRRLKVVRALPDTPGTPDTPDTPDTQGNGSDEGRGASTAAASALQAYGGARGAWTTPTVRILETVVRRVADGYDSWTTENSFYVPQS